jgi:plasmid stabilization system protein ParE
MIVLSPDALTDIERLRTFLDQVNPGAARRAMAAILMAIERLLRPEGAPRTSTSNNQSSLFLRVKCRRCRLSWRPTSFRIVRSTPIRQVEIAC